MLVDQIVTVYDSAETLSVVWQTALRRLEEGNAARLANDANWWKAREAAFVMLGTINEHLLEHMQVRVRHLGSSELEPLGLVATPETWVYGEFAPSGWPAFCLAPPQLHSPATERTTH